MRVVLCWTALLALSLAIGCGRVAPTARTPAAAVVAARPAPPPTPAFTGPVIELTGSGDEIGAAHARQLSDSIHTLYDNYLNVYLGTGTKRFLALGAAHLFERQLLPEHLAEVEALARTSNVDEAQAMLAQCFLDLSPITACSTIALPASASRDHVARFGRNLDFPSLHIADKYSTVFVYHPEGRFAFVSIAWPGMIGVLSGMNEHGLALANMEITRTGSFPKAMPYTLLYRTVLEQCRTVDEAIGLLKRTPRQTPNNLMLMDASGDRAVVELSP